MKKNLWLIGLILVIVAAFGFAYGAAKENSNTWIASTILVVIGGLVLLVSYFLYHKRPIKKSK